MLTTRRALTRSEDQLAQLERDIDSLEKMFQYAVDVSRCAQPRYALPY